MALNVLVRLVRLHLADATCIVHWDNSGGKTVYSYCIYLQLVSMHATVYISNTAAVYDMNEAFFQNSQKSNITCRSDWNCWFWLLSFFVQNVRQTVSEQTKLSTDLSVDFRGCVCFSNIPIRYAEHIAFSLCGVIS